MRVSAVERVTRANGVWIPTFPIPDRTSYANTCSVGSHLMTGGAKRARKDEDGPPLLQGIADESNDAVLCTFCFC